VRRLVVVAALLLAPAAAAAATGTQPLDDPAFTTAVPAGWHERSTHQHGRRAHFFNSGSGHANDLGLPPHGQIGLTIGVHHIARGTSVSRALHTNVGYPRGATGLKGSPAHKTRLAGARAGAVTLKYRYKGARWVQSDVVAIHGTTLAFLEVDAGLAKARAARRTLATVRRNWRWK
jgi:hypothetical protein